MSQKFNSHGLTLVELVLAVLLVNVVVLTGLSMEMGMRKLFTGTDFTVELNNEAVGVLQLVTKVINRAIGAQRIAGLEPFRTEVAPLSHAWSIWQDTNGNGVPDPGIDTRCAFRYFISGPNVGQVVYYRDVADMLLGNPPTSVLTTHCPAPLGVNAGFRITDPALAASYGFSNIRLLLRRDILAAPNATNPQLDFYSRAQYLGASFS
jgi:hypothetical protein